MTTLSTIPTTVNIQSSNDVFMAGMIAYWPTSVVPAGWVLCYGQAISRTVNAALFAVIGTTHGTGDGSTTFNIPDGRGCVLVGPDTMANSAVNRLTANNIIAARGGIQTHTLTVEQMPTHTHNLSNVNPQHNHAMPYAIVAASGSSNYASAFFGYAGPIIYPTADSANTDHEHTVPSTTGNQAHNNAQPYLAINQIIKL